ncbi:MAG: glyoxylate/hydroxypyruvate reductase A [Robiginitalea sp.]
MALVIVRNDPLVNHWKKALQQVAPDIPIYGIGEDLPPEDIQMAAVWKHPPGSLSAFPNLKGIHCLGAGVDFILEDPSIPENLPIMRVVDPFLASDMAEYVLAQVMAHLKDIHRYKQDQISGKWLPKKYKRISDVTVGIMGLGTLGKAVADLLGGTGFSLTGWTRATDPEVDFPTFRGVEERVSFLEQADILVCLLPLTPDTRGILDYTLLSRLPEGALLINVARGPLLVDDDLIRALDEGLLSGACLDVFHTEPLPESHPFWEHPAVHITPHVASVSDPDSVAPQIIDNYRRLIKGSPLKNTVSRVRGY